MAKPSSTRSKRHGRPFYKRIAIDIAGFSLMILAVLTGWLPGPGGIPLFLLGLGILSLNYEWAERLLKNFDDKRREYTDKYLMASPKASRAVDITAGLVLIGAVSGAFIANVLWLRAICLGLGLLALVILLSNRKRFERIAKSVRKSI